MKRIALSDMSIADLIGAGYIELTDLGKYTLERERHEIDLRLGRVEGPLPEGEEDLRVGRPNWAWW